MDDPVDRQSGPDVRVLADDAAELPERIQIDYKEYFAGDPRNRVRAARDVLMDLPRLENSACEPRNPGGNHGRKVIMRLRSVGVSPVFGAAALMCDFGHGTRPDAVGNGRRAR